MVSFVLECWFLSRDAWDFAIHQISKLDRLHFITRSLRFLFSNRGGCLKFHNDIWWAMWLYPLALCWECIWGMRFFVGRVLPSLTWHFVESGSDCMIMRSFLFQVSIGIFHSRISQFSIRDCQWPLCISSIASWNRDRCPNEEKRTSIYKHQPPIINNNGTMSSMKNQPIKSLYPRRLGEAIMVL